MLNQSGKPSMQRISMAMSPHPSTFAPLVFAGNLEEGMKVLAEAGFSGVEISLCSVDDLDADWLADRLSEFDLKLSAVASGRVCLEESLCLCDPHPAIREMALERLTSILKLAARFKAPVIIGGIRGKLIGEDTEKAEQRENTVKSLRRCAAIAADLGTHLLLEPINRYETNFINNAQDGLRLIEDIGHPNVKLLLDTFHMNIEEADPCATIRKVGSRLGYMHFADNNRLAPGQGHIDFPALLRALAEIGYSGFISAEILPIPDDATALKQTGQYLHSLISEIAGPSS